MVESEKEDTIDQITKVLRENEQFTKTNTLAKNTYDGIVELINDVIDLLGHMPDADKFVRSAKYNFILTNLMPSSYSILLNFLAGNIPPCFMQIRTTVEFLVESYVADTEYPNEEFFYDKLQKVQEKRDREKIRLYKFISKIDGKAANLWRQCSEWGHAQSLAKKLVEQISDDLPVWALVIPMPYDERDEQSLRELQEATMQLRNILKSIIEKY